MIGSKRDLWDLIQTVEKVEPGCGDITDTVRQLTSVNTGAGRVRAWLRLAVMQKKLADYIKILVDDKYLLAEYYEPEALMRSEEAVLLCGLMVSLNIVDCNICLKEEDLDSQEGVIDLTYYLRRKEDIGRDDSQEDGMESLSDIKAVIDQKSYIEEVNRNLSANVSNLQARIDSLTNMNAIMREDVAISKKKTAALEEENKTLLSQLEKLPIATAYKSKEDRKVDNMDPSKEDEFEAELKQLKISNHDLEKELILEVQMKAEMEMAMKLLEKDVHEKQDTIISLRSQLEDIKGINLEMYTKLAECEKALSYKSEMIQKLEKKTFSMAETLEQLDNKFKDTEKSLQGSKAENISLLTRVNDSQGRVIELESDLKIEREWRERLQESSVQDRESLSNLRQDNDFLKQVSMDYENLRQNNDKLKEQMKENELTLEELGQQLSWSKMQVKDLKVISLIDSFTQNNRLSLSNYIKLKDDKTVGGTWQDDSDATKCSICEKDFNISRRKHHCRNCGGIFCGKCSDNTMALASSAKPLR